MKLRGLAINTADMADLIKCVIANGGHIAGYSLRSDTGRELARLTDDDLLLMSQKLAA